MVIFIGNIPNVKESFIQLLADASDSGVLVIASTQVSQGDGRGLDFWLNYEFIFRFVSSRMFYVTVMELCSLFSTLSKVLHWVRNDGSLCHGCCSSRSRCGLGE